MEKYFIWLLFGTTVKRNLGGTFAMFEGAS